MSIGTDMVNREVTAYAEAGHAELAYERAVAALDLHGAAFTAWRELAAVLLERLPEIASELLAAAASRLETGDGFRVLAEVLPRAAMANVCVAACESPRPHPEAVRIGLVAAMLCDDQRSLNRLIGHLDALDPGVGPAIERRARDLGKQASAMLLASARALSPVG